MVGGIGKSWLSHSYKQRSSYTHYKANAIGMAIADVIIPAIVTDADQVQLGVW